MRALILTALISIGAVAAPLPNVIECHRGGSGPIPGGTSINVSFTAADCGGVLPNGQYFGAPAVVQVSGGTNQFTVVQTGQTSVNDAGSVQGPGIWATCSNIGWDGGNPQWYPCNNFVFSVLFMRR